MIPVQGIVAVAQAQHERAMKEVAAMHDLAVAKHVADARGSDDALPFHDAAPHLVDIRTRRTLCNYRLSDCLICDRVIFPYRDDSNYDILIPSLGCAEACGTCRWRFGEEAYDEWFQALRDHRHLIELADSADAPEAVDAHEEPDGALVGLYPAGVDGADAH